MSRLLVNFAPSGPLEIPLAYNAILQGMIYHHLPGEMADALHEEGFGAGDRRFRLFTFSRLLGPAKVYQGKIRFSGPFSLIVSSADNGFIESLASGLARAGEVRLARSAAPLQSLGIEEHPPDFSAGSAVVSMLSPLTIYSTLSHPDGRTKTYYYSPFEKEFTELLRGNLLRKYEAAYGAPPSDGSFAIVPQRVSSEDQKTVLYRDFVVKGWLGGYRISGSPELLRLAYDTGLGGKNAQGFGCFTVD